MTWVATARARDGDVLVELPHGYPAIAMAPEIARSLAAVLLIVAERADSGDTGNGQETVSDETVE